MSHYGTTPNALAGAIVTALQPLVRSGSSGVLRALKRYAGDRLDLESVDLQIASSGGVPAALVAYLGGTFAMDDTTQRRLTHRMRFSVVVASGSFESVAKRLSDGEAGVEDLLDAVTYYAARGLATSAGETWEEAASGERRKGVTLVQPTAHKWLRVEPGKYLAAVELEASRRFDFWDDEPEAEFTTLGLVHSPLGPDDTPATPGDLFEDDGETPKQTPPEVGGGVTEL